MRGRQILYLKIGRAPNRPRVGVGPALRAASKLTFPAAPSGWRAVSVDRPAHQRGFLVRVC
jgi:hypothetical protein